VASILLILHRPWLTLLSADAFQRLTHRTPDQLKSTPIQQVDHNS